MTVLSHQRQRLLGIIAALLLALCVVGCAAEQPAPRTSASAAVQPARSRPPSTPASPSAAPSASLPRPTPREAGAAPVVIAYYQAINEQDYVRAWHLLGASTTSQSYRQFVAGFVGTDHDVLTIVGTAGGTVRIRLRAYQTDGTVDTYAGTYTVRAGIIAGASVHPVQSGSARTCGAPRNPFGYTLCPTGQLIYAPPSSFCSYFDCIPNFPNGTGYVVECNDSMFSHSGGRQGACSYHDGEQRPLYAIR